MTSKKVLMMVAVLLWALVAYGAQGALSAGDKNAGASDRERAGLHGPVQTCVEETTYAGTEQKSSTTTVYDRAGHILLRTSGSGKVGLVERYTYSPGGRLLKMASGKADGPLKQTIYSYDDQGRLVRVAAEGRPRTDFTYDEQGRKTSVQIAGPKRTNNDAVGVGPRDGSDEAFLFTATAMCDAVGACASTKTIYNQQDHPAQAELRDRNGMVITRILRNFDPSGNVTGERQETEHPELMVPDELRGQLNPAQMQAAGKLFAGFSAATSAYAYDAQHRLKEMRTVNPMMGEELTTITYNEHGDRAEEHVSRNGTQGFSGSLTEQGTILPGAPSGGMPPEESDTRYTYIYDDHGNWTQQTVEVRSKPGEPFSLLRSVTRELTYGMQSQP